MKTTCFVISAVALAAFSTTAFAQELPTQKMLTLDVAQTIAQGAMEKCRSEGYKVTVTIVDSSNLPKLLLRDDGAARATVQIGQMKINSVMAFGRPSGPPPNLPAGAPVPPPILPNTINAMGGLPIQAGGQLIGAVSVSGAPGGDKDAACAEAGLAKVADRLK
jgi:uncharacterized protein GlcG (DUF336 family)